MATKERKRKCFKCGCSPELDNVKLFRFPKPRTRNNLKCALWAKYIFPEDQQHCCYEFQMKLYAEHRMLCNLHFRAEDFSDNSKTKLKRTANPQDDENELNIEQSQNFQYSLVPSQAGMVPFRDVTNLVAEELPSATSSTVQPVCVSSNSSMKKKQKEDVLYLKCAKYMRQVCQLRYRIKNLKKRAILNILSENEAVKNLSNKITPTFALLLKGQLRNTKKKPLGRRWTKAGKITALRLYKRSPTCYRLLRRLFPLPSATTLKTVLNKVNFGVGVNNAVFEVLSKHASNQDPSKNLYTLMLDEMSLKKHLNYNPRTDEIEGYQDHGSQGRDSLIAGYALVFMIAGIRQKVKQPIAHYFSSGFSTADRLAVLIKEVLKKCFDAGLNIACIVCDMDGVNRRAMTILGASVEHPFITVHNTEIYTLFDTPHLLKCFRNLWLKYDIECPADLSSSKVMGRGIAKWSHIKEFYDLDSSNPNFVFAPALKKDHLDPNTKQKMKVKLAAQVLSHSVAGGIYAKISAGDMTADATITANVCENMDKLFDSLNSDCSDLRRGKPHATNLRQSSPQIDHLNKMIKFFKLMKFINCLRTPPSQEGWIWTINGILMLWTHLVKTYGIKNLATRRLQQDPLENLFGTIRGNCGSNTNPTTAQFTAGLKTTLLSNLAHLNNTGGNCENDNNVLIDNFNTMLTVSRPVTYLHSEPEILPLPDIHEMLEKSLNEDNAEIQACAYVCGFLIKKLGVTCDNCKKLFLCKSAEPHHLFIDFREYREFKKSLIYVSKDLVVCVEFCATVVNNFLNKKGYRTNLKVSIVKNIEKNVDFNFMNACKIHKESNLKHIIDGVFMICVKRFCIVKNREFAGEATASALKRKIKILQNK